jgi:Fe-S-cluster-containing hydrogenase component 2
MIEDSTMHLIRDNSKCILCRRCVAVCDKVQGVGVIEQTTAASRRISPARLTGTWTRLPAYPADSALRFARPARLWKRIIPRRYGRRLTIRASMLS